MRKKDGSWLYYIGFRAVNNATIKDAYLLPLIIECKDSLAGKSNSQATFQRVMHLVLSCLIWSMVIVYLDDINITGATFEETLLNLRSCWPGSNSLDWNWSHANVPFSRQKWSSWAGWPHQRGLRWLRSMSKQCRIGRDLRVEKRYSSSSGISRHQCSIIRSHQTESRVEMGWCTHESIWDLEEDHDKWTSTGLPQCQGSVYTGYRCIRSAHRSSAQPSTGWKEAANLFRK